MKNDSNVKIGIGLLGMFFLIEMILTGIVAADTDKQYTSSLQCKSCHEQTYNEWNGSMHAQALVDPIYLGALAQQKDKSFCISCHAPTTRFTGDFNLTNDVTKEAITCDFCHTVSGLNASNPIQPFLLNPGGIKYGPYADAVSSSHKTQNLEMLTKSEFCGGCHELAFPNGLIAIGTYSEWKNSDYANSGTQCQDCHMPKIKRSIAIGATERDSNKHTFGGGHSLEMLQSAGNFSIDAKTNGSEVQVTAVITNDRAGHIFPTAGQLVLNISATDKDGKVLYGGKKILSKVYGDANGNIVPAPDIATQILSDTRVPPKGNSINEFAFDVPSYEGDVKITGTLYYRLEPEEVAPIPVVKISESSKIVTLTGENNKKKGAFSIPGFETIFAVISIISIYLLRRKKKLI